MMHQPPPQQTQQNVETVIKDLERQRDVLTNSIQWVKNLSAAILALKPKGVIRYINASVITAESRFVDIAFFLPVDGRTERVNTFSICCPYSERELREAAHDEHGALENMRYLQAQQWLKVYGVRPFETWIVDEGESIWQGGETETIAWMNRAVSAWLRYWFHFSMRVEYYSPAGCKVEYLGQRMPITDRPTDRRLAPPGSQRPLPST